MEKWSKRQELKFYFCIRAPTFSPHGFLLSKFASQIKLCNLWWGSVASHRVPFSGFHVPRSQVPRPRLQSLRVPGCRLPESRVSGPDFGLCVERHLVRGKFIWKRLCGTSSHYPLFAGTVYFYLLYRVFLTFSNKFCCTNFKVSANQWWSIHKWANHCLEVIMRSLQIINSLGSFISTFALLNPDINVGQGRRHIIL